MADASGREALPPRRPRSNLVTRVIAALVLVPLALVTAWLGGWPFALFWALGAAAVLYEWIALVSGPRRALWIAGGVLYAGLLLAATLLLRADPAFGLTAILLVFAVVWSTDIAGYFVGRAIGGRKLAPHISPGKTWAGAIGGAVAAVLAAAAVAALTPSAAVLPLAALGLLLSIASQGGDLFESFIKRHFGAKDAGFLIPGHGGVMDRVDGFCAAVVLAALIGLMRGGFAAPARGLMLW